MGNNMLPDNIAFTCICREPEGDILRTVRHIEFNADNLNKLWNQVSKFPTFMGVEINNVEDMLRYFVDEDSNGMLKPKGLCLVIDDFVGLFWLTDIKGINEASVHYTFFDKRHRGRLELCKKAIEFCFNSFHFHRLWTMAPVIEKGVIYFIKQLKFVEVGRLRRNTYFKGKWFDTYLYDILREDFLNGIRN